jgi:hypothetical protein
MVRALAVEDPALIERSLAPCAAASVGGCGRGFLQKLLLRSDPQTAETRLSSYPQGFERSQRSGKPQLAVLRPAF